MDRFRRNAALLGFVSLTMALPFVVRAGPPDPLHCDVDPIIFMAPEVMLTTAISPFHRPFRAVIRDADGNPLPGVDVILDFATTGVKPAVSQISPMVTVCAGPAIAVPTNAAGMAAGFLAGGGLVHDPAVAVSAGGVFLRDVIVRSSDYDANGDTDGFDFDRFRTNFLKHPENTESDFNFDGIVDVIDFDIFRKMLIKPGGTPYCP